MRHSHPLPIAAPRPNADLNPRRDPPLDFPDRDFGELSPADYQALGFMCGLEVHQQLATRRKLFCRCPAGVYGERVDAEVLRHMRPTLSELGQYDGTALMEFKTRKEIVYRLSRSSVCTYEIDDTPPFPIDPEAIKISLEIARLFDLELVQELHVMRKQYLDGSIPTGFQRTAMVGLGGRIPFAASELGPGRELRIRQLSLEEDSCREVSDVGHRITFVTDRLGMPLVETVTEPDLLTPIDVQRGGALLAQVARVSGKVRRGPGAARQDVNVSIAGGRRIEIKGVPSHRVLPRLVHTEAFRQLALLRIKAELERRGLAPSLLPDPLPGPAWETSPFVVDARSILRKSEFAPVQEAHERGDMIVAVRLPRFRRLLGQRTQPGISFARELSERVRVIACLTARPFMLHSDVVDYGFKGSRWNQLRAALRADGTDAIVVLWGPADDADTAAREVIARAREALEGVPAETRQAHHDGTTGFERILPGPDRMYPDTDTPPHPIPDAWVAELHLAERPWQRSARYRDLGLTPAAAERLAAAPWAELFDAVRPPAGAIARRLAAALEKRVPGLDAPPDAERLAALVAALAERPLLASAFEDLVVAAAEQPERSVAELLAGYPPASDAEIDRMMTACDAERSKLRSSDPEAALRWAMGRVMPALRGRVDPTSLLARLAPLLEVAA